jgi:hypothetical protein
MREGSPWKEHLARVDQGIDGPVRIRSNILESLLSEDARVTMGDG